MKSPSLMRSFMSCDKLGYYTHTLAPVRINPDWVGARRLNDANVQRCFLYASACPLVCGWYAVDVKGFRPRSVHMVSKILLTNCWPLSMGQNPGIPYDITQRWKAMDTICGAEAIFD